MLVQQRAPPPPSPTPPRYSHYSTVEQMAQKPTTLSIIHHAYSAPQFAWAPLLRSSCRESTWLRGRSTAPPEGEGKWGKEQGYSEVSALLCLKLKYANRLSSGIPTGTSQLQRFERWVREKLGAHWFLNSLISMGRWGVLIRWRSRSWLLCSAARS